VVVVHDHEVDDGEGDAPVEPAPPSSD
jgi:hypothetical protein